VFYQANHLALTLRGPSANRLLTPSIRDPHRSLFYSAKKYGRLKKRAQATDSSACSATGERNPDGDEGDGEAPATTGNASPKPKRRTLAKPRANGNGNGNAASASGPSEADDAGPSGEAPITPASAKRKRASPNDAARNSSDAEHDSASEAATDYNGSRFVAVNHTQTHEPAAKHAKAR
jgi:hypothetical protein